MRDIVVFAGSSHPQLGEAIAMRLGIPLGAVKLGRFSNNETSVQVAESVRDLDVFIIQSGCGHVNNHLMELLILINACRMASAAKVTVVLPLFPYSRQTDTPYKRNGLPRRLQTIEAANTPVTRQLLNQHTARKERKLRDVGGEGSAPLFGPPSGGSDEGRSRSKSPERGLVSNLHVASSLTVDERNTTIISSPLHPTVSALGLAKTGYRHWVAKSGTLIANMIMSAGANHIITMDLHDPQFQGYFEIPVDNLFGAPLMIKYIREKIPDYKNCVIVSPDAGGAKRASSIAHKLGTTFALVHKERKFQHNNTSPLFGSSTNNNKSQISLTDSADSVSQSVCGAGEPEAHDSMMLVGNVKGKTCILIDDIADTSRTITKAADLLASHGATKIYAIVTHGVLSGDSTTLIKESKIDFLVVSNSTPQDKNQAALGSQLKVFDLAGIFAEAIRRVHHGESVSYLYEPVEL